MHLGRLAIAALALSLAGMAPAAAPEDDRLVTTEWVPEALDLAGREIEVRLDRPFLVAQVTPGELAALSAPLLSPAGGGEIAPAGTKVFRLHTAATPVYCTVHGRPNWGVLRRTIRVHVCLVDADRDGRFESFYDERADHASFPLFRGPFPAQRTAIAPLAFAPLERAEFIREFESLGVRQDSRMSVFLKWRGVQVRCYFGSPRYGVLHVPLADYIVLPRQSDLPRGIELCGAAFTVLERGGERLRLRVERTYPTVPWLIFLPRQIF